MKKHLLFCLAFGLYASPMAQTPVSDCGSARYVQTVFTDFNKETIQYGANVNQGGSVPIPLFLDIYTPKNDTATLRPVIVLAHGGTFIFGDKSDLAATCSEFVRRGYVAVSIQYRLFPAFQLGIPDSLKLMTQAIMVMGDMKAAIRFLREDAATQNKYKIHPDWILCGGYSAGAVAALHVAQLDSTDQIPAFMQAAITQQGGINGNTGSATNRTFSSDVRAVVNMSGALYTPDFLDAKSKPMFSIHGTADNTVPYTSGLAANIMTLHGSGNLHTRAQQLNLTHRLRTVQGGGHTDIYTTATYAPVVFAFISQTASDLKQLFCSGFVHTQDLDRQDTAWSLFPNPVASVLQFNFPAHVKDAEIQILNSSGKLVLDRHLGIGASVQVDHLPAGIYFIKARTAELDLPVQRFVKL